MKKYSFITKNFLIEEYIKKEKSRNQIAIELNCDLGVIKDRLVKFNIPIRTMSETMKGNKNGLIDGRCSKTYYCKESKCNNKICYWNWLYGNKRCPSCAHKYSWKTSQKLKNRDVSGKKHGNYIDGKSRESYPLKFNEQLKEQIRKRDNYKCKNCGITEEEYLIIYGRILGVHHIDYNKENCKENNLITLCNQCNSRANYNRNYWFAYFTYIMEDWK